MSINPHAAGVMYQAREGDADELPWLADIGELAGPLAHEFNNYLNCVLLHVAILESEVEAELQSELAAVRRLSADITTLVHQFQEYRSQQRPEAVPSDLNGAILRAMNRLTADAASTMDGPYRITTPLGEAPVTLRLCPDLPHVPVTATDLERLALFLVANAAAASVGGEVTVRTERIRERVQLSVEDSGPLLPLADLPRFFELATTPRRGSNILELAACKSLVIRTEGKIKAVNLAETGMAVRVWWDLE